MTKELEISMVGELNYFLGFQDQSTEGGMFVSWNTYAQNLAKRFDKETTS